MPALPQSHAFRSRGAARRRVVRWVHTCIIGLRRTELPRMAPIPGPLILNAGRGDGAGPIRANRTHCALVLDTGCTARCTVSGNRNGWCDAVGYSRSNIHRILGSARNRPTIFRKLELRHSDIWLRDFYISGGDSIPYLAFGVALFGWGIGNVTSLPPLLGQQDFGAADQQRVVALIVAYAQAAFALAPAVFGFVRSSGSAPDTSPLSIFMLATACQIMAIVSLLAGRRRSSQPEANAAL